MDASFSKLRFKEFATAAAAGLIAGAIALQPTDSRAATGSVKIFTTNPAGQRVEWFVNTNITFSTTSSGSLAMSEASMRTTGTVDNFNRSDAFDGALAWHANAPPGPAFPNLGPGAYLKAHTGPVSVTANSVVGPNVTLAGLNTHVELFFSGTQNVVRSIFYLQNPTGAPIAATVDNDNNLGSDSGTTILATSSGDATYDPTDNWTISCQQPGICNNVGGAQDPIITMAFQGPGATRATTVHAPANGSDTPNFRWAVTVPAGETRALMMFVQLSDTPADAEAQAPLFNSNDTLIGTDYLTGLSSQQLSEIVNWNVTGVGVPTLTQWAQAGMALLLGVAGLVSTGLFGWRRHRSARST
jgi:hypothetical protein